MASPEQRIYQNSPAAPSPRELKDGLRLLLDTHGNRSLGSSLIVHLKESKLDGMPTAAMQFNSFLNKNNSGHVGFNILSKVERFEIGKPIDLHYKMEVAIDVYSDRRRKKLIAKNMHSGRQLTDMERRAAGQIILAAWETTVPQNAIPSKR